FVDSNVSSPCSGQLQYPGNLNVSGNPPVTYYWRVSVETNGTFGPYSTVSSLTVPTESSGTLLAKPTITRPGNNATNISPNVTFQWQAVPNAIDYLVVWQPSNASSYSFQYTAATQLTPTNPLTPGTAYDVFVAARDKFGTSDPPATAHFTTSGTAPSSVLSRRLVPGVAHGARSPRRP
ncbi:MAG: fibronectin type III domain-containing protein, partial [Candidatus Dormibacteraceae bacterium]